MLKCNIKYAYFKMNQNMDSVSKCSWILDNFTLTSNNNIEDFEISRKLSSILYLDYETALLPVICTTLLSPTSNL
jgi:hypothetical protein